MTALAPAPFFSEVALGPEGGQAWWLTASDGVRLRLGLWPLDGARGTVLIFPGRTEYIEKYALVARDLQAAGYAVAAVDWRGQGLADRALEPRDLGHVEDFAEFQLDVTAVTAALTEIGAPKPWHLIAHSMGGLIGLRALYGGLDVDRVVFSAPMWGIAMSRTSRIFSHILSYVAGPLGLDKRFAPTTRPWAPSAFKNNTLTNDPEQFAYMEHQVAVHRDLALGGPSTRWMLAALAESSNLMAKPAPDKPVLTFLGTSERVVSKQAIRQRMQDWPGGRLEVLDGAEHEVLMETAGIRNAALEQTLSWFEND